MRYVKKAERETFVEENNSFILTMRYVKSRDISYAAEKSYCFILTMRYVKQLQLYHHHLLKLVLY